MIQDQNLIPERLPCLYTYVLAILWYRTRSFHGLKTFSHCHEFMSLSLFTPKTSSLSHASNYSPLSLASFGTLSTVFFIIKICRTSHSLSNLTCVCSLLSPDTVQDSMSTVPHSTPHWTQSESCPATNGDKRKRILHSQNIIYDPNLILTSKAAYLHVSIIKPTLLTCLWAMVFSLNMSYLPVSFLFGKSIIMTQKTFPFV